MNQVLHTQLTPPASIDSYRWQKNIDPPESHLASTKRSRNRGVFLSHHGWQKLVQAGALHNKFGERYTYEHLSERSLLDERTISRLLSCEVKVDKSTLKTFFRTFNLSLEAEDFTAFKESYRDMETWGYGEFLCNFSPAPLPLSESPRLPLSSAQHPLPHTTVTIQRSEFEEIVEELVQLRQRLREYDRLFRRLSLNEKHPIQQLGA